MTSRRLGGRAIVAALALITAGTAAPAATASSEADVEHYVALGDSYTSGPLIPFMRLDPLACARSTNNYPALLAEQLRPETFADVSCAGADTTHMTAPQGSPIPYNPPQLEALTTETDLVTLGIGGNDFDVFGDLVSTCTALRSEDPTGAPCREHFAADDGDDVLRRIALTETRVTEVLRRIGELSPDARVLVVGYPRIVPASGYCPDRLPLADGDYAYAREIEQALNDALDDAAARTDATYVDTYTHSRGHDVCATGGAAWINGQHLSLVAAPFHPFASGMAGVASIVSDVLRGQEPDVAAAERAATRARVEARQQAQHVNGEYEARYAAVMGRIGADGDVAEY